MQVQSPTAQKLLAAMARVSYPVSRGVAADLIATPKRFVRPAMRVLVEAGLAETKPGAQYQITPAGRAALGVQ